MRNEILTSLFISLTAASAIASVNTSLWFDGSDQQVNTGGDCIYEWDVCESKMGWWYEYDDSKLDGTSYTLFPYNPGGKNDEPYYGSAYAPEVEYFGYITAKYVLRDPLKTGAYNYIGLGFNLVDEKPSPLDISGLDGLCVSYTSNHPVRFIISNETTGDYSYYVTLPTSTSPTTTNYV